MSSSNTSFSSSRSSKSSDCDPNGNSERGSRLSIFSRRSGSKSSIDEPKIIMKTAKPDPRFHQQNVSNWCMGSFIDYQKCCRLLGKENETCEVFKRIYEPICPNSWVERWLEQIENGIFPVNLPEEKTEE